MQAFIEDRLDEIAELCRRHHVKRLALFGSAARDDFDPERSDVDLLVEFDRNTSYPYRYFKNYFALKSALSALFGREVDLLEFGSVSNPYRRQAMEEDQELLYAA